MCFGGIFFCLEQYKGREDNFKSEMTVIFGTLESFPVVSFRMQGLAQIQYKE